MYANSSYHHGASAPPPPARPSSSYDPYADQYSGPHTASLSPHSRLHAYPSSPASSSSSRPMSFAGHPQSPPSHDPLHRLSYSPGSSTYPQPLQHSSASVPTLGVHEQPRPLSGSGSWPVPQRQGAGRPGSSNDASFLDDRFSRMSMSPPTSAMHSPYPSQCSPPKPHTPAPPSTPPMTCSIPSIEGLVRTERSLDAKSDNDKLHWAQDVLRVLERHLRPEGQPIDFADCDEDPPAPVPPPILDLLNTAIPIIISFTTHRNSSIAALACYLKAVLLTDGSAPDYLPRDPRQAFKDFETAARGGEARGWYRLGRDYEGVGDIGRARDCFERGRARGDVESLYRLGMATLLGQLAFSPSPSAALPLLAHAASAATPDFPQPAYVYGMILAGEFHAASIPPSLVLPPTSQSPSLDAQHALARQHLERAAYLCYPPAQYKLGHIYEHAALGAPYDPLKSVQWHSLASQGGEFEADMALSKWFLCGAEGCFGKNEELARTFAEKAAKAGLGTGCFALGYYNEVGIGGRRDTEVARQWYEQAARVGNPDALSRLAALSKPAAQVLSMQDHQQQLNNTLVRKHTLAQAKSDHYPGARPPRRQQQIDTMRIEAEREARRAAAAQQSQYHPASPVPQLQPTPQPVPQPTPYPASHPTPQPSLQPQPYPSGYRPSGSSPRPSSLPTPSPHMAPRPATQSQPQPSPGLVPPTMQTYRPVDLSAHPPSSHPQLDLGNRPPKKNGKPGPQTFAEMGFVSKPVQDDGCLIM